MNPPKGIDPKVWEMAEMLVVSVEAMPSDGNIYNIAKAISRAIEAEREECARIIDLKLGRGYAEGIRNRSNTTTERNEG